MRKRIYRISEDKFDDLKPNIEFSSDFIESSCYSGESFCGSFFAKSTNKVPIRGIVYCSNPYVKVKEPQFEGELINVEYSVDNIWAKPGETIEGEFVFLAVGVEKTIPFKIVYEVHPLVTSFGEITSLEEYAKKAQGRFTDAVNIFYSEAFERFIKTLDPKTNLLYRGFRGNAISPVNVDEFLVACGLKTKMTFDLTERTDKYFDVCENVKGEIDITRSTWGYIDIEVKSDSDFVTVEKNHITADFFLGSVFNMSYYVHKEKMHAGKNYARITFDYRDCHKELVVMATCSKEDDLGQGEAHKRNLVKLQLCRAYEDFRLRKISPAKWSAKNLELIDELGEDLSENMILLVKALVYITNKQRQEALWIIQDLKRSIEDKRSTEWVFLLYLCTLIEREESYVDRITNEIENIYREHSDDPLIFWFLLNLRKEYVKNPTAKLRGIAASIAEGHESPCLFIEAYFVYLQDPYLLNTLDDFSLKILNWARKRGAITREIALQMIHVLETQRNYVKKALPILEACYEIYPDDKFLLSIVSFLLKAPAQESDFFKWYKLSISKNLHVPGIYEAYMATLDSQSVEKLPQLVTMFFRYNNDLPYEKKALLYANIILHKNEDMETYKQYERAIEMFAIDQLKMGHLDDNLAICYQLLLEIGLLDREMAKLLASFVFRKKIAIIHPDIRHVILYQEEYTNPQIAPVKDHQAYITQIGSKGIIFLENNEGHLITDTSGYFVEDVIDSTGLMGKLRDLCPESFAFVLEDLKSKNSAEEFNSSDIETVETFLQSPIIQNSYRISMYEKIIEYLRFNNREDILEKHFMKDADLEALSDKVVAQVIEVLVIRSKYEEAYYMMQHTNASKVKPAVLTKLCRFMLNRVGNKPDDYLITLTAYLISQGIVHSDMIFYLVQNYVGPTDLMMKIYAAGFEAGIDMVQFSERILTQSIYRDFMPDNIIEVFDSYMVRKTNRMIVEAFLTFEAHEYLSKQAEISENIFAYIYNRINKLLPVNETMKIALLKFLCLEDELGEDEFIVLDKLLGECVIRNQYFGFYAKCDRRLQIKYHLYDKHFIEFKGEKHKAVEIRYSINDRPLQTEDMIEMYDGLFVKEFVLFFGDELKYEVYCEELSDEALLTGSFIDTDNFAESIGGRYSLMNDISRFRISKDKEELSEAIKKYQGLDAVTKELFSII